MNDYFDTDIPYERITTPHQQSSSLHELIDQTFTSAQTYKKIKTSRKVLAIWYAINGDQERKHTTGATLTNPHHGASDPRLVVYVDSNVLLSDFRTNTELYLSRLFMAGINLSGIDFRLSRNTNRRFQTQTIKRELPELTQEQKEEINKLTKDLEEPLRSKVATAMSASIRQENKAE